MLAVCGRMQPRRDVGRGPIHDAANGRSDSSTSGAAGRCPAGSSSIAAEKSPHLGVLSCTSRSSVSLRVAYGGGVAGACLRAPVARWVRAALLRASSAGPAALATGVTGLGEAGGRKPGGEIQWRLSVACLAEARRAPDTIVSAALVERKGEKPAAREGAEFKGK
eukprot:scaffold5504_cov101-Isochrysis_galbana.AAC.10